MIAKDAWLAAMPLPLETVMGPDWAPILGTRAIIVVSEITVYAKPSTPLKRTLITPVKPVPVSVTTSPYCPAAGVKLRTANILDGVAILLAEGPHAATYRALVKASAITRLIVMKRRTPQVPLADQRHARGEGPDCSILTADARCVLQITRVGVVQAVLSQR